MGFSVSIYSHPYIGNYIETSDCHQYNPGYSFYHFVSSFERFGEESILIQSGRYFGLDLTSFAKLVYTWDDVTDDYIENNLQDAASLRNLALSFLNGLKSNRDCFNKITYKDNDANPYDWNHYFKHGQVQSDLTNLINGIECYEKKGKTKVYLTAG